MGRGGKSINQMRTKKKGDKEYVKLRNKED